MEIKPLRDKFDLDAVAALVGVDGATLRPHQQAFDAELAAVLRGEDAVWKVSLLAGLLDYRAGAETVRAAERIAACPTAAERAEGQMKRRGIFWCGGGSLKRGFSLATSLCYAGGF